MMVNNRTGKNNKSSVTGRTGRFIVVMLALVLLLFFALILNINTGSVYIGPGEIIRLLKEGLDEASTESMILFRIRLPRMMLAAVLGGALSVSGYLLQVFFRNPIAGPFVLGISSGAKMLVGLTLISFYGITGGLSSLSMIAAAFAGSLIITGVVLLFAQKVNNMSMLLVVGIMVGYICSAVTDFFVTFAHDHDVVNLTTWSMGSFSGANWDTVKMSLMFCIPGLVIALMMSKPIGAYSLGEGYAKSMGINVKAFRVIIILLSSLLSGCVTALAGPISFVGIAVPHITKSMLKSARPVFVIPSVFLCGAVFCVFCDLIARTVFAPTDLAIGTVTSVTGAPIVIYMMIKRRRQTEE